MKLLILFMISTGSVALLLSPPVFAGDSGLLHLEQAIAEGQEKSPTIQRVRAAFDESYWKKTETLGTGFLPKLSANANYFFDTKYQVITVPLEGQTVSFPSIYPTTLLSFNVMIPIFDGLANVYRLQSASLTEEASKNELSRSEFQLEQNIKSAFYQALGAKLIEEVYQQNVKTLEDHLTQAEILKHGGAATNYDVLRVQVQLNAARSDLLDAKDNVEITRRKLTLLLGLEKTDDRVLDGSLPVPQTTLVQDLQFDPNLSSRTDLKALALRAEASDKIANAQSTWLVPSISIGGEYDFYNNLNTSISDTNSFQGAYNFGVFLKWNLFDGGASYARSRQASYQKIQADKTEEEIKLQAPYDFDTWKRRYLSNVFRYEAKSLDVKRSQESVRLAREEEKAGSRTSTEVLDAELDLFQAKAGVVNSQIHSAEALINLELTLGRRI